ncbi:MAG: CDP-alcohol phosphatidyltransferase family protein [Chloroflexi bacterium]|nr:CDP-alcohol phosphatidyltransferase family protein [Chloroflexota bacterium]
MTKLPSTRKAIASYLTQPIVGLLAKTPVTPNTLTWTGFLITLGAAALIATGHLFAAGFVVILAGFFDILDGALARSTSRITRFGGVLDSTLDRLSEAAVLLGVLFLYASERAIAEIVVVGLTLTGSFLVSYVRARAEAAGLQGQEGLFTRAERVVVLALGLLLSQIDNALVIALVLIMIFSFITVGQRLVYVWQQTKGQSGGK